MREQEEKRYVEKELSVLIEKTLRLEDEINSLKVREN